MQEDRQGTTGLPVIEQLKMFYNVHSDKELIMEMHYHINKLQNKVLLAKPGSRNPNDYLTKVRFA